MTDQTAPDTEPTSLPAALVELRHARVEIARLKPFVAVADGASRAAEHWETEAKRWLAFIQRGMDTHTQFNLLHPDGTIEQLPCADWCYACRLERAEAELKRYTEADSADAAAGSYAHRAENAEAAIARVRAIKKSPSRSPYNTYTNAQDDGWDQALEAVLAALDGTEQPTT